MWRETIIAKAIALTAFLFILSSFFSLSDADQDRSSLSSLSLDYWRTTLNLSPAGLNTIKIEKDFSQSQEIYSFTPKEVIYGLSIDASLQLHSDNSLVRIILVADNSREYLVYESYPLLVDTTTYTITGACEETCLLTPVTPVSLKVVLIDASLNINTISLRVVPPVEKVKMLPFRQQVRKAQQDGKIKRLNARIKAKGQKWIAGETSISRLSYDERRRLFGTDRVPNLQGAEYYKGGVFEVNPQDTTTSPKLMFGSGAPLIESFDWRNRHGANNPTSPYYDGDPTGSGWITPVKNQDCSHCWAFSSTHATEAIVNLYFNQHLDLDLSEQDTASCSGGSVGCCRGGLVTRALDYIINTGIIDEGCFAYSASCESCSNRCSNPGNRIRISGKLSPGYDEQAIKMAIINYGPITCGIESWWHAMVLVGFDKDPDDGETIWIFKNSHGVDWGENGYGYLKVSLDDLEDGEGSKKALLTPAISLLTPYEIACYDRDGDGYYNWGISENKPPSCPGDSSPEKDCDDSNPLLGPFDPNGNCISLSEDTTPPSPPTGLRIED